jgi:hypothetical protein
MDHLVNATNRFTGEQNRSPFVEVVAKSIPEQIVEKFDPILPPVDYDAFEASLGALLTEAGGIGSTVSGEELCKLVQKHDMTPERRALVIEILKRTRTAYSTNGFLAGGLETIVSWLEVNNLIL